MTSVSRPQYRPPPPPPPPPEPRPLQQTQPPAVTETKAADAQQAQNKPADTQQTQPYVHPFDKSSFEPATAASGSPGSNEPVRNVRQTNDVDCGVGALATLGSAAHPELNDEQLRNQVRTNAQNINDSQNEEGLSPVDLGNGITPQEMTQLAGQQGLETKTFGNFDSGALEKHVTEGNDALMLVDTNALSNARTGTNDKPVGKDGEHWLVVDDVRQARGTDGKTEPVYSIKDPSTNEKYELTRDQMEHVVNAGREGENHTGGGLLVKQAQTGNRNDLSAANVKTASVETTGDDGGTGPGSRNYSNTTN